MFCILNTLMMYHVESIIECNRNAAFENSFAVKFNCLSRTVVGLKPQHSLSPQGPAPLGRPGGCVASKCFSQKQKKNPINHESFCFKRRCCIHCPASWSLPFSLLMLLPYNMGYLRGITIPAWYRSVTGVVTTTCVVALTCVVRDTCVVSRYLRGVEASPAW